jgi:hypothetical protein
MDDEFEYLMEPDGWGREGAAARLALRQVTDVLNICGAWWEQHGRGVQPTAADLLTMVRMVLERDGTSRTNHH